METALHTFLSSVPQAAAIWIAMLAVVAIAAVAVLRPRRAAPAPARRPGLIDPGRAADGAGRAGAATRNPGRAGEGAGCAGEAALNPGHAGDNAVVADDDALDARAAPGEDAVDARCADEIAIAADRAAATARRRRAEWDEAQAAVDAAWADYEQADRAARRVAAASAFPALTRGSAGTYADRQRNLHRAATAACRRREITIRQLNEALAHRGWDPRLHPIAQEAVLCTTARQNRLAAYRQATARERAAWAACEAAAAALASLRAEALDAWVRVGERLPEAGAQWWAEQWSATQPPPVLSTVDAPHPVAA